MNRPPIARPAAPAKTAAVAAKPAKTVVASNQILTLP